MVQRAQCRFFIADPAALRSPVIDDDVFGYRKVNGAQRADPDLLLNRMRDDPSARHTSPLAGGGALLEPAQRAVVAYMRTYAGETIPGRHQPGTRLPSLDLTWQPGPASNL
jgi:hypothetical protein